MMRSKNRFLVVLLIVFILLSSTTYASAMPTRPPSRPTGETGGKDALMTYMGLSNDLMYYVSLRDMVLDTQTYTSLESRRRGVEDLVSYIPRIEKGLAELDASSSSSMRIFGIMMNRSISLLIGNQKYTPILMESLIGAYQIDSMVDMVGEFIEYDSQELIEYAVSIYSKQLAIGEKRGSLKNYRAELEEMVEHSRSCLALSEKSTTYQFSKAFSFSIGGFPLILPAPDGGSDSDGDGLTDFVEEQIGTNKRLRDTDNDGIEDYDEIYLYHTDPVDSDTDNDGVSDGDEVKNGTDPVQKESLELPINPFYDENGDTDLDGLNDKKEIAIGTSILLQDTDHDGINDKIEYDMGLDPTDMDTDKDGVDDLKDLYPLDPTRGEGGINIHDDEEVLMVMYGAIAVSATFAALFGCSSCTGVAVRATIELIQLYEKEMQERENGTDED